MGNKVTYNDVVIEDGGRTNIYAKEPTMYPNEKLFRLRCQ